MTTLLICIGAQKAATTWLADYMRSRPGVHLPPVKEVHYFDARYAPEWCAKYESEMLDEFQREAAALTLETCADPARQHKLHSMLLRFRMIDNPQDYLRFMSWGARPGEVLFEATPDYSMLDRKGFAAMRAMHADTRLIFLMRNPADRYWSSMKFNAKYLSSFDIDERFSQLIDREDFRLLSDYGRTIREAEAVFGRERLHLEFYERLFDQAAVDRICRFAGLASHPAEFGFRSNSSTQDDMPAARRAEAVQAFSHVYREIAEYFQGDIPESWKRDLASIGG